MNEEEAIRAVKRRHSAEVLGQRGVSGFGIEKDPAGQYVLTIHVDTDDPEVHKKLPSQIEGYRVKLVKSGPFQKQSS